VTLLVLDTWAVLAVLVGNSHVPEFAGARGDFADAPLVTCDAHLAAAPVNHADVELFVPNAV